MQSHRRNSFICKPRKASHTSKVLTVPPDAQLANKPHDTRDRDLRHHRQSQLVLRTFVSQSSLDSSARRASFSAASKMFSRGLFLSRFASMAAYSIIIVSAERFGESILIEAPFHTVGLIFAMRSNARVVDTTST